MLYLVCLELAVWALNEWKIETSEVCSVWSGDSVG